MSLPATNPPTEIAVLNRAVREYVYASQQLAASVEREDWALAEKWADYAACLAMTCRELDPDGTKAGA